MDRTLIDAVSRRLRDDPEVLAGGRDRPIMRRAVARALAAEGVVVAPDVWARLVRDLVDELAGLGPLQELLRDPDVTDVLVNAPDDVHVERSGRLERVAVRFDDEEHLRRMLARVLAPVGVRLDRSSPYVDAILPEGLRIHAIVPPLTDGVLLTIRRVTSVVPTWEELEASTAVPRAVAQLLREAVRQRRNVVVCGPAGAGKTTLLARLLSEVGTDRVVLIEDESELRTPDAHIVALRTRSANSEGVGRVEMADLVRNALRMRPERIVVGEVRGREVADLLQALNTGHDGSMTSVHANGAAEAIVRLEGMALLAGVPLSAARAQISSGIDLVVAMDRDSLGLRRVAEVSEVVPEGHEPRTFTIWSRTP